MNLTCPICGTPINTTGRGRGRGRPSEFCSRRCRYQLSVKHQLQEARDAFPRYAKASFEELRDMDLYRPDILWESFYLDKTPHGRVMALLYRMGETSRHVLFQRAYLPAKALSEVLLDLEARGIVTRRQTHPARAGRPTTFYSPTYTVDKATGPG